MKDYGKAKTLKELKEKIQLAIEEFGPETEWHGWDDGSLILSLVPYREIGFIDSTHYSEEEEVGI